MNDATAALTAAFALTCLALGAVAALQLAALAATAVWDAVRDRAAR